MCVHSPNLSVGHHQCILESITTFFDSISTASPGTKFLFCGDFNDFSTALFGQRLLCVDRVRIPTRGNSILDQIWVSESIEGHYPDLAVIGPPLGTSDHNCVLLKPITEATTGNEVTKTVFDYRRENICNFLAKISALGFHEVYTSSNVNEKCAAFYRTLYDAMNTIPRSSVTFSNRDKPWLTPVLKQLIQDRWDAYRTGNWPLYNHMRDKVKQEIIKAKRIWGDKVLLRDKNPWNIVREISGKKLDARFQVNDSNLASFVCSLSGIFQANFNEKEDVDLSSLSDEQWSVSVDPITVHRLLRRMKLKQSPGHDGIAARLLKEAADLIYEPLSEIFQSSINTRCFPDFWKYGIVCPIPKVNRPSVHDYRPISLLPILSKLFEKIILLSMKGNFIAAFGSNQHAFRPLGSSTSALVDIHDTITSYMENPDNIGVRVTCFDFAKAFDKLQHHRLINHLAQGGFNHGFLLWLLSYLKGRLQRLKVRDMPGTVIEVRSGVPQGSVLGPYLFATFIASLSIDAPNVKLIKYADDLTLVESVTSGSINNTSLSAVLQWSASNNMVLNIRKCKQMLITRAKVSSMPIPAYSNIEVTPTLRVLGITFNKQLNWIDHFEQVILSASRRLHILRSLKPLVPKVKLVEVFRAYILSVVLYASPVFGPLPSSVSHKIGILAKRAHRIICDPFCSCSIIPDISSIRDLLSTSLLFKCELLAHPLHASVPARLPRSGRFRMPMCSTSRRLNSFFPHSCMLVNRDMSY